MNLRIITNFWHSWCYFFFSSNNNVAGVLTDGVVLTVAGILTTVDVVLTVAGILTIVDVVLTVAGIWIIDVVLTVAGILTVDGVLTVAGVPSIAGVLLGVPTVPRNKLASRRCCFFMFILGKDLLRSIYF
jgi:hypothetical protein